MVVDMVQHHQYLVMVEGATIMVDSTVQGATIMVHSTVEGTTKMVDSMVEGTTVMVDSTIMVVGVAAADRIILAPQKVMVLLVLVLVLVVNKSMDNNQ